MDVGAQALGDHASACGPEAVERVAAAAEPLQGMRVLHVSVAGGGGAVPELLGSVLPLAADVGLRIDWRVLFGDAELRALSAGLREGLQGAERAIGDGDWRDYLETCRGAVAGLADGYDAVVLHDPGALGLAEPLGEDGSVVWRCHVDASRPDRPAWDRAAPLIGSCAAAVFPDRSFAPEGLEEASVHAIAPGIDPLGPRNGEIAPLLAGRALRQLGLDLDRPLCSQLMRLDGWKDPHATIEAFAAVTEELPQLQLVIGCELDAGAADGWPAVKEISDYASGQGDIHVLTSYSGKLGNLELGALNQLSRVAVRLSLREGFGLAASEALWRGTPVVGGREGGTALQVRDGIDGYLVDDTAETAERIVELVRDPGLAIEMGRAGRERVRERFLVTRALEDELGLLAALS